MHKASILFTKFYLRESNYMTSKIHNQNEVSVPIKSMAKNIPLDGFIKGDASEIDISVLGSGLNQMCRKDSQ